MPATAEVVKFVQMLLVLAFYGISTTAFHSKDFKGMYRTPPMSRKDLTTTRKHLSQQFCVSVNSDVAMLDKMEDKWRKVFLVKDVTAITIDNDKHNSRSTKWKEDGFAKIWLFSEKFFFRICCACSDDVVIRVHDRKVKSSGGKCEHDYLG